LLLTRRDGRLCLVTHPDHGRLAGDLYRRWGNDRFTRPAAADDALLIAAIHHDDGWQELDGRPAFNSEQGRPAHFLELPLEQTVGPYGRGVDTVYERDPHAGALVSMHWAGLYRTRWGVQGGGPVPHPLAAEVVSEQETRWVAALREAWGGRGPRSEFERDTWHAYEILQALDFLSLALCLLDTERQSGPGDPVAMPGTLPSVDQPIGARSIPSVPAGAGGAEHVNITLRVSAPHTVTLDPYPFSEDGFEVTVPARGLDDRRYTSDQESAKAYHAAAPEAVTIKLARA
jgi:Protein of unknown function (DUF3891)